MLESEVGDSTYSYSYICTLCVVIAFVKRTNLMRLLGINPYSVRFTVTHNDFRLHHFPSHHQEVEEIWLPL